MKTKPVVIAILAAGKGTRMKSDLPKVLHPVSGKPMILQVIAMAEKLNPDKIISIIGHGRDQVIKVLAETKSEYVIQSKQLGTGHAVQQLEKSLIDFRGELVVLSGDVPLLRSETLSSLLNTHRSENAEATLLTALYNNPAGYGRIVREPDGSFNRIVEHKDCNEKQLQIDEINAGIYVFNAKNLFRALKEIKNDNTQQEYYLPDALEYFFRNNLKIALSVISDPLEIQGVNTVEQLNEINRIFETRSDQ